MSPKDTALNQAEWAWERIRDTHLSSFATPEAITTQMGTHRNGFRSAWFERMALDPGYTRPAILTLEFPAVDAMGNYETSAGKYEEEIRLTLEGLGLEMLVWTKGTGFTIYAAMPTGEPGEDPEPYLPADTSGEEQPSRSGMYFNPEMKKQGNPPKRMRLLSLAQGAWSVERPSRKPYLQIPIPTHSTKMFPDGHLKMEFRDTQGRGDGSGMIEESAGRLLILRAGASLSGDIIGLQTHFWGADYAFKGVSLFQPAHRFPDGVHWIIDQDSTNTDVYNHRYTEAKVAPWRHKSNKRYFAQDPVFLGETAMSDVDAREVAQVNLALAVRLDQENWTRALCKDQRPALSPASQTHEIGYRKQRDLVEILQEQDETDMLLTAYEHSGGSIHALPDLMRRVTGGVYGHWKSKHWDYRWDRPGNIPTVMVSGETVTLMSPEYAGAPVPPREHIGFVRHPRREDQIIGVVMHPEDDLNSKSALDGQDYDGDKVSFTLRRGSRGEAYAKVMRSPQSIGGGYTLKVQDEDDEWLQQLGYHFYRKTGGERYPGLHEIRRGERVMPDMLAPVPYEKPTKWGTDPAGAVENVLAFARYRKVIGQITNAENNLDSPGHYDPAVHKLNRSDHIDADLHADKDPSGTPRELLQHLHELVMAGEPMDPCFYDRVEKQLQELHERNGDKRPFPAKHQVKMRCPEWHLTAKESMGKAVSHLQKMMDTRLLMSHGPIDWLLEEEYSGDLTAIVQRVLNERFQAWSQSGKAKAQIKRDRKTDPETKRKQENLLNTRTRDSEREIILRGYREATEIPGHRPGKFMAAYILMSIRDSKRIKRRSNRGNDPKGNSMTWKPITTTRSLSALPVEEHRGYFERGRTAPTAIVRTRERIDPRHIGARCRITPIVQAGRTTGYNVTGEEGDILARLEGNADSEGAFHVKHELTVSGYLPGMGPDMKPNVKPDPSAPWMQLPNQLVLEQRMMKRDYFRIPAAEGEGEKEREQMQELERELRHPHHTLSWQERAWKMEELIGRWEEMLSRQDEDQVSLPESLYGSVPWEKLPPLVAEEMIRPRNFPEGGEMNPVLNEEDLAQIKGA
jgi:hypothetical protein